MHPMAIVVKGSMTYLICMMDEDPITPRYLPIHRFKEVELLTDQKIKQPENFSLDDFIHTNNLGFTNSDKLYTFKAIFNKTSAAHLTETKLNNTQTVSETNDGRLIVSARVPDTLQFEQWLMSFGSKVEILEPPELKSKFKKLTKELVNIYS
jgi:predicted DNA-binding transcriptional regulator YafY